MHTGRLQWWASAERNPLRDDLKMDLWRCEGVAEAGEGKRQPGALVHSRFGACIHQVLLKSGWNNPWALPGYIWSLSTKWLLFINMLSKSLREGAVEDQGQNSCNYFLSYPVCDFATHPINSWGRFLHPLYLGWLWDLFWKVECGSCDGWYARSKPRSPEVLNTPFSLCETCIATMGTHSSQLAWWWETYYFGWLPDSTRHVCEAIFDPPPVDHKCLNEPRRDDLSDQWSVAQISRNAHWP